MNKDILYEKYNRIFINEKLVRENGYDPNPLKKLSQKDKWDVYTSKH